MHSIPQQPEPHQGSPSPPIDLSYRRIGRLSQPHYRLAVRRADCLLREFLHGRVKVRVQADDGRPVYLPVLAEDVPPVLLGHTAGIYTTPYAGIRYQGSSRDPGIHLLRYYAKHHRLAIETEDAVTRTTRLGVLDFDGGPDHGEPLRDPLGAARDTTAYLRTLGWPSYLVRSNSGAGYHLYLFFQDPLPSADVRRVLAHVLRIDDDERARVEINPLERTGPHGSLIHLPWWSHSRPGGNVFIDPETAEEIALPDGGVFARIPTDQVTALLATWPPPAVEPSTDGEPAPAPTTRTAAAPAPPSGTSSPAMQTWRTRVQGDRRLHEAVYGAYLTGTTQGEWLECRDPASPTGDRHPSAGVNSHSGVFYSHRRRQAQSIFDMMLELGQAATIGEAYRRAEAITGLSRPAPPRTPTWHPADRYVLPTADPSPALPEGFTLDEAREMLGEIVREEIQPRVVRRQSGAFLLHAGTGVGKSRALSALVADLVTAPGQDTETPTRVLWLTDSKHNRDERARELRALISAASSHTPTPELIVAHARTPERGAPGYCRQYGLAQYLAGRRQPITETLCKRCQTEVKEEAKRAWDALPPEERTQTTAEALETPCVYLAARAHYKTAQVVVGTKASFQFGGDLIEGFDLIVIDEQAVETCFTTCDITAADIAQWEARQEHDPELWAVLKPVLSLLKQTLVMGKAEDMTLSPAGTPLVALLRQLAPNLDDLVEHLWHRMPSDPWHLTTPFDQADVARVWQFREAPLLILRTLVDLLTAECRRGTARDTQCWVIPASGSTQATLQLTLIREDLLHSLQSRVVVFLDATAHGPTLQRLWGEGLRQYRIPVQTQCYTTVFTDLLYRASQIQQDPDREARLLGAVRQICAQASHPMLVGEKALVERWKERGWLPAQALVTHWGAADMAGSNRYRDCDLFIGIGHPRGRDETLIRQTIGLRAWTGNREPLPEDYDHFATVRIPTPYVGYHDLDGRAWVRRVRYPADPDACDRVLTAYAAQFTQAIGRVRPADPRPQPIPVYLFTGEAPRDLRIDALATLESWTAEELGEEGGVVRSTFQAGGAHANRQRAEATLEKYLAVGRQMHADRKRITAASLYRECGGSRSTAQKYYPQVLAALGIAAPPLFVRPRPMDATDPLAEVYRRGAQWYPGAIACWDGMTAQAVRHWWAVEQFQEAYTGRRLLQPDEIADYAQAVPLLQAHARERDAELQQWDAQWQAETAESAPPLTEADFWQMVEDAQTPEWCAEQACEAWWRSLTMAEKRAMIQEKCGKAA
jgi:hypothetical protein